MTHQLLLTGNESIGDIAERMGVSGAELIRTGLSRLGLLVTLTERRERAEVERLAREFGFRVRWIGSPPASSS